MSLLTALIAKNSHILAGIYFIFLKTLQDQFWKAINTKFETQSKDRESSYPVSQILAPFCILVARTLGWNCVKGLEFTKIVKQTNFEGSGAS